MIQETHSHAANASERASARSSMADFTEDEDTLSTVAHERAMKQQEHTSQSYFAQLPKEKTEGGKGEDKDPLSIHLAQGRQPQGTTGQQVSQNLEESFLTDDKPTCQRRNSTRAYDRRLTTMMDKMDNKSGGAKNTIKMNGRPVYQNKSRTRCVHIENSSMSLCDKFVSIGSRHKRSAFLCMCRIFILISLVVAATNLRVMMFADAAFAPKARIQLQGNGEDTLDGVIGCVGKCGEMRGNGDGTYCVGGAWLSGSGNPCKNAESAVPPDQGTGKYGTMASWDVSRVDNMRLSKFVPSFYQCESL